MAHPPRTQGSGRVPRGWRRSPLLPLIARHDQHFWAIVLIYLYEFFLIPYCF